MFQTTYFPANGQLIIHAPDQRVTPDDLFEKDLLFVWDDLMDPHKVREITGRYIPMTPAVLHDFARRKATAPFVSGCVLKKSAGDFVLGAVLIGANEEEAEALAKKCLFPMRAVREKVEVLMGDLPRVAMTYLPI